MKPAVTVSQNYKQLVMHLVRAQQVAVEVHLINGKRVQQFSSERFLEAGTHEFALDKMIGMNGILFIQITGEDFNETVKINVTR